MGVIQNDGEIPMVARAKITQDYSARFKIVSSDVVSWISIIWDIYPAIDSCTDFAI